MNEDKAAQHAELEQRLKSMIQQHGYDKTVATLEAAWTERQCTWPAFQQLINLARNVNNQINRSKTKEKK